jgi:hypothetical protein
MNTSDVEQLIQTIRLLEEFFDADADKISLWLMTKNPHLGNIEPMEFFLRGRGKKVFKFAENALEENKE